MIAIGHSGGRAVVSLAVHENPMFSTFELDEKDQENRPLNDAAIFSSADLMSKLSLHNVQKTVPQVARRVRTCGLSSEHQAVVGGCSVYQISLIDPRDYPRIQQTLTATPGAPGFLWCWPVQKGRYDYASELHRLVKELANPHGAGSMPFPILFQPQRLAQNNFLSPRLVLELLPAVRKLSKKFDKNALAEGIRGLANDLAWPGPDVEASQFLLTNLIEVIKQKTAALRYKTSEYARLEHQTHLMLVHKVLVTPTGTYLEGPFVEPQNRVTRKYPDNADYFLRVTFAEEDGEPIHFQ